MGEKQPHRLVARVHVVGIQALDGDLPVRVTAFEDRGGRAAPNRAVVDVNVGEWNEPLANAPRLTSAVAVGENTLHPLELGESLEQLLPHGV